MIIYEWVIITFDNMLQDCKNNKKSYYPSWLSDLSHFIKILVLMVLGISKRIQLFLNIFER